ncbi:hypothetical protein JCM13664_02540 [Methylothermus subterraneus]
MDKTPWWASTHFWKKTAIWVTAGSFLLLIGLTFDTMAKIQAGSRRVPSYAVIDQHIDYRYDASKRRYLPVIEGSAPLFGKPLAEEEAARLVALGKKTIQAKNCMNCHTLLGNGAYYAPDLTKAWLDPAWGPENVRPMLMKLFLMDPESNARTYGTGRKMPKLKITEQEAEGIVAFLKWMAAIDTNGFPYNFKTTGGE